MYINLLKKFRFNFLYNSWIQFIGKNSLLSIIFKYLPMKLTSSVNTLDLAISNELQWILIKNFWAQYSNSFILKSVCNMWLGSLEQRFIVVYCCLCCIIIIMILVHNIHTLIFSCLIEYTIRWNEHEYLSKLI